MKKLALLGIVALTPLLTFAQQDFDPGGQFFGRYLVGVLEFINNTLVPLVFALAFLAFIWGALRYFVWGASDEGKREEGRNLMLWGIIGFVLMVSVWGIVNFVAEGIGFGGNEEIQDIPNVPFDNR